ncbi:MAG: hypothetical protein ACJA0Q_000505 [Saprospiraceae bacterium]|jgi:hypothetical protein
MIKSLYRFLSPRIQNVFLDYKVNFKPRSGHGVGDAPSVLYKLIDEHRSSYESLLTEFVKYKEVFHGIKLTGEQDNENLPAWNNDFLPGLDIVGIYGMVRHFSPKKYIEVGSGNSTKVVKKAVLEGCLNTEITSIDPYPRANIDHLADKVIRQPIEDIKDLSFVEELEAGDILFIDNSHRCLPNSDVTVCFLELFPKLKKGVIVHVHDIYLPYDYPQFMCDRAYSEQYVLAAFILANSKKYKPIMPNYFVSEDEDLKKVLLPIWDHKVMETVERHGGSFWLEIGE